MSGYTAPVDLPVVVPVAPMLAKLARALPNGEIVVVRHGRFDFDALMTRLHPARSFVAERAVEAPATFIAFDVLAVGTDDVRDRPFVERRQMLETLFDGVAGGGRLAVTPLTRDRGLAQRWLDRAGGGVDGVVAKAGGSRYEPGKRAMVKVKRERSADCVVAGFRWLGRERLVSSLLLGVYDGEASLRHVGVAASFPRARRVALVEELRGYATSLEGHPWEHGFGLEGGRLGRLKGTAGRWEPEMGLDWVPLRPELVCEVAYDQLEGVRFRHPARFLRWRHDRDGSSCTTAQFVSAGDEEAPWPIT